jgi:hypothetical protein
MVLNCRRSYVEPLYCSEVWPMRSKLQLRHHCGDLKIHYIEAAIAVEAHKLKP